MGIESNIDYNSFPKQGDWLGKRTKVCFKYDTEHIIMGTIVRDDAEHPFKCIIQLDNGSFVLTTECMHSPE